MKIVGTGAKVIDQELLAKLAVSKKSNNNINKTEAQRAVGAARTALRDQFDGASSSRGLARAEKAVANTLKLAIESGWVTSGVAKDVIMSFVDGAGSNSLSDVVTDIKADIKGSSRGSTSYGGRTSTVSYGGGRRTTPRPAPAPRRTRPVGT